MIESTAVSRLPSWSSALAKAAGAALLVAIVQGGALAQVTPKEGANYNVVKPAQPTSAPAGKVEVIEFFGYWCPHCNDFEPVLSDWAKRNDAKVSMVYVPVPLQFRPDEVGLQRLYYTLEVLGKEKELRRKVFSSIHGDHSLPASPDVNALADWAAKNGVDRKKFVDTYNSFTVQTRVTRANQIAAAYGLSSVPALGVGGRYLTSIDARSIGNADYFVSKVASEK